MAIFARPKLSEVRRSQLRALFHEAPLWLMISQTLAIGLAVFLWSQSPIPLQGKIWPQVQWNPLLTWLCLITLFTLFQALVILCFRRVKNRPHSVALWRTLFHAGVLLIGSHWGAAAILLPQNDHQALLLAAALTTLLIMAHSLFRHSFGAFAILTVTALAPSLAWTISHVDAGLPRVPLSLLMAALLASAWRENRKARASLFQRLEYASLVDYLDNARLVAEQLNQQLSDEVRQRKAVEHELQNSQRELEQKILDRTRELSETNDLLSQQIKLRKSISDALVKSQTRLSQAIEASHLALWDWDLTTGQVYQSHFNDVFGPREVSSNDFVENMRTRIHPDDFERTREEMAAYLRGERERYMAQYRVRTANDRWMWVEDCGKAVRVEKGGRVCRMLGTRRDITEEKQRDEQLRMAKSVFDNTSEGVFVLSPDFRFVSVNQAFSRITGYREDEVLGRPIVDFSSMPRKQEVFAQARESLEQSGVFKAELFERRKNGDYYPEWIQINAIRNGAGELTHYAGLFSDLTERKQADEKLKYLLNYDDLTGLANRVLFLDRLHNALIKARSHEAGYALLSINIDRFKQINESLGHDTGDEVLKQLAQRLASAVPNADTLARVGNDEFNVLVETDSRTRTATLADDILTRLRAPLFINDNEILMAVSIGITMLPDNALEIQPALQQANTAVRQAKYLGGNTYEFYSTALQAVSRQRLQLETELRKALQTDALEVYYQPKLRLSDGRIDGVEALVRWHHPERGIVSPGEFVPIAEESGLISEIGERVLRIACRQAQLWHQNGLGTIKVAVNLSAYQLRQTNLALIVRSALKESGLDPRLLDLELTESALMENISRSLNLLGKLRAMGINVTIDDFGTGYSSLSYLKRFPVDAIKIDQIFIKDVPHNPEDAAITKAIIVLAQSLKMEVIAEGVESKEQCDFLAKHGCDVVQGFHISKPQNAERITELLAAQRNELQRPAHAEPASPEHRHSSVPGSFT